MADISGLGGNSMFGFPVFGFDLTFVLLVPALILAMYAQARVSTTFARYSKERTASGLTGGQVARRLLDANGLRNVEVEVTQGSLTDHYDPRKRILRLSPGVYEGNSMAAFGVAAHETGHALQHAGGYLPLGIRNNIFPVASLGSQAAMPLFIIGLIFRLGPFMQIGILFFAVSVVFQIVTLPVEFNASGRALHLLQEQRFLVGDEISGAKKVLSAAALTYLAAALMAVLQLVRLLVLRNSRRD